MLAFTCRELDGLQNDIDKQLPANYNPSIILFREKFELLTLNVAIYKCSGHQITLPHNTIYTVRV